MKLGHAQVSTEGQNLEGQCQRLSATEGEKLFQEKISSATRNHPKLEKLIEHLRKDDILVVTRLAHSTSCESPSASPKKVPDYNRLMSRGPTRQALPAGWS